MIIGVTVAAGAHVVDSVALNTHTKSALVTLSQRYRVCGETPVPGLRLIALHRLAKPTTFMETQVCSAKLNPLHEGPRPDAHIQFRFLAI
jgi:hypothetical protein